LLADKDEQDRKLGRAKMYLGFLQSGWMRLNELNARQFHELDAYMFALQKKREFEEASK